MRLQLKIILLLLLPVLSIGQQNFPDSLRKIFSNAKDDSVRYQAANNLYNYYEELNRDSAFFYADRCVELSHSNNKKLNEAYSLTRKAYQQANLGRYAESLHNLLDAFSISENEANDKYFWSIDPLRAEQNKRLYALACTHHIYGVLMRETQNREQQLVHFKEAKKISVEINSPARSLLASANLGRIYMESGKPDSALMYENDAASISRNSGRERYLSTILYFTGLIYMNKGDSTDAVHYFYECTKSAIEQNNMDALARGYNSLAKYYMAKMQKDSGIYYAMKSLEISKGLGTLSQLDYNTGTAYESVYKAFKLNGQFDSAYKYLALAQLTNDSINRNRIRNLAEFQKLTLSEQQRLQNIEKENVIYQNEVRTYFLLSGIAVLLVLAVIFYRNNRQKHKANIKIEKAYSELKSTQAQLIQSEKMASLGELTAGIAHEIQNPLNFVNNFSEVNKELIDEVESERSKVNGEKDEQLQTELLNDIKQNTEKIIHHGKRADSIVKGMLQHSQAGKGQKELTDINALCDEYLRLSYHGLRAKDKDFNATIKTDFDESIGNINIIPQNIGRVLLNLYNNAFYAVNEKKKQQPGSYEPTVSIKTKKLDGKIEISVKDNGNGIPEKVVAKIFQPFFTTKPTGQGTGLGLSLSYDIIKAHSGEIKVESKEEVGSEFIIQLPTE